MPPAWHHFFARVARVIRLPDNFLLASGMNTNDEACGANQEGATRWTRGGAGVASVLEVCLKDSSDVYAWTQQASGGTVGLAAHIVDTTTHGTTGNIVGTSDVQTLTNKTLTSPAITTPTGIVKGDVGLGNVDNTSDATKNAAAVTLTNKTLSAPVIADFTNMAHDHQDADDGGSLNAAAIGSGVIATARLGSGTADSLVFLRGDQTWSSLPIAPGVWPAAFVDAFGTNGTSNGQFDGIRGAAWKPATEHLYVSSDNRIQKFSSNGTWLATIATFGSGDGEVDTPEGLAFDPNTNLLLAADGGNDRVLVFDTTTDSYVTSFGTSGTGDANFDHPVSIAIRFSATLAADVIDSGNAARKTWSRNPATGAWSQTVVTTTLDFDEFRSVVAEPVPIELAVTYVYVNEVDDTVEVRGWPSQQTIGGPGTAPGSFDAPYGVALDTFNNRYITDRGNNRVQVFNRSGLFAGLFGEFGSNDGQFSSPTAIVVTDQYIYVADDGNSRVQIFVNATGPGALSVHDDDFTIVDQTDTSKAVQFSADGITTGTTRTLTLPDKDGSIMGLYIPFWTYTPTLSAQYNWTNMPAAETEFISSPFWRVPVDLTGMTEARLHVYVSVVGHTTAEFRLQYSTDNSTYQAAAASGNITVPIAATGVGVGSWGAIAAGAKGAVYIRPVGAGGNAVADPQVLTLGVQFR